MVENRYTGILVKGYPKLLEISPAHPTLRVLLALELKKIARPGLRVLDFGCGEGDSIIPIMEHTDLKMDALDISEEMLEKCKKNISKYLDRVNLICEDALSYLQRCGEYDIITCSWTLHNFTHEDKRKILKKVHEKLSDEGIFILMDKVYPDSNSKWMMDKQNQRNEYLHKELRDAIVAHEEDDYGEEYRMDEIPFVRELRNLGFKDIRILDRVEREIVLVAHK